MLEELEDLSFLRVLLETVVFELDRERRPLGLKILLAVSFGPITESRLLMLFLGWSRLAGSLCLFTTTLGVHRRCKDSNLTKNKFRQTSTVERVWEPCSAHLLDGVSSVLYRLSTTLRCPSFEFVSAFSRANRL